jgi:hypothetical protein
MDKTQYFITLAAWVGAIFFTIKTFVIMLADYEYNHTSHGRLKKAFDNIAGYHRTFKLKYNPSIAVGCFIWLVVYYFG